MSEIFEPFYKYLESQRQALLTQLDSIERLMGISPRTAELRRLAKNIEILPTDNLAGAVVYDPE